MSLDPEHVEGHTRKALSPLKAVSLSKRSKGLEVLSLSKGSNGSRNAKAPTSYPRTGYRPPSSWEKNEKVCENLPVIRVTAVGPEPAESPEHVKAAESPERVEGIERVERTQAPGPVRKAERSETKPWAEVGGLKSDEVDENNTPAIVSSIDPSLFTSYRLPPAIIAANPFRRKKQHPSAGVASAQVHPWVQTSAQTAHPRAHTSLRNALVLIH